MKHRTTNDMGENTRVEIKACFLSLFISKCREKVVVTLSERIRLRSLLLLLDGFLLSSSSGDHVERGGFKFGQLLQVFSSSSSSMCLAGFRSKRERKNVVGQEFVRRGRGHELRERERK